MDLLNCNTLENLDLCADLLTFSKEWNFRFFLRTFCLFAACIPLVILPPIKTVRMLFAFCNKEALSFQSLCITLIQSLSQLLNFLSFVEFYLRTQMKWFKSDDFIWNVETKLYFYGFVFYSFRRLYCLSFIVWKR